MHGASCTAIIAQQLLPITLAPSEMRACSTTMVWLAPAFVGVAANLMQSASSPRRPPPAPAVLHATLQIAVTEQVVPVLAPGRLFGSFFEDFLHAGDGGVYAEKISNRALALPLSNTSSFRCSGDVGSGLCTWFAEHGSVHRDTSAPLNDAVAHAMWLTGPTAIASNGGFPGGIAVRAGDKLELSLFVFVRSGPVSLEARLVDGMSAGSTLGNVSLLHDAAVHPHWVQIKTQLMVNISSGPDGCRFQLRLASSPGGTETPQPEVGVTVVSLFPVETWMSRPSGFNKLLYFIPCSATRCLSA